MKKHTYIKTLYLFVITTLFFAILLLFAFAISKLFKESFSLVCAGFFGGWIFLALFGEVKRIADEKD